MSYILISYTLYLILTLVLIIWVARKLFSNGKIFLLDIFHGNKELANAVNNLLLVGFHKGLVSKWEPSFLFSVVCTS
jgi:hypothetical protein